MSFDFKVRVGLNMEVYLVIFYHARADNSGLNRTEYTNTLYR